MASVKRLSAGLIASLMSLAVFAQTGQQDENTLLWKITGNGLEKPSWIFGTIHMICADDAKLSENMRKAIGSVDEVYFEVDMDNLMEMFGALNEMKMKGDTTLRDLLSEGDYEKVKNYFESHNSLLPFSMLETFKPILAASTLQEDALACTSTAVMEEVIMREARTKEKKIRGLESMSYQASLLDSIPYRMQAEQLVSYIDRAGKEGAEDKELAEMMKAYKKQDLKKLEELMVASDAGLSGFTDILLYNRNYNWAGKLKDLMPGNSLLIAVGAGHLPGEKGMINLLRLAGFTLTPVDNKVSTLREI
jgi:uncharacterized protein YbaP (TraB family)